jgi:hypothetical protein
MTSPSAQVIVGDGGRRELGDILEADALEELR